jgi:glycosyltransferase involved in cell wall biosynthesis
MLPLSVPRLERLMADMQEKGQVGAESRIVYVDDGSTDATWDVICSQHGRNPLHCGLRLGRNAGHQNALLAGLEASVGKADCVVTADADLQDDVQVIPEMVRRYLDGYEIVYGVRCDRSSDTFLKRNTALGFYRLMRWLGSPTVYNHADFRLLGSRAVRQLSEYRERDIFLRGIVPLLGFPSATVSYERRRREAGRTKYSLGKMAVLAVRGITSASVRPIRLVSAFGLLFVLAALGVAAWVLWCMYAGRNVSGWVSLMLSVWFIGGCILMALGLIGEYVAKIVVDVKLRPRYNIVEERI